MFEAGNNKIVKDNSSKVNEIVLNLSKFNKLKNNKSENLIYKINIKAIKKSTFFNF